MYSGANTRCFILELRQGRDIDEKRKEKKEELTP